MSAGTFTPPKRTRPVVECELAMAEARIDSLRRRMDVLESDSEASRIHAWYSTRAALLRRELEDLDGRRVHPWDKY